MRFDLSPLYRSTIGFDRLASLLDQVGGVDVEPTAYPPYNIERLSENDYRITMAIAGFSKDDVTIEIKESTLSVRGEKKAEANSERQILHRGIAGRAFERRFQLADHVQVVTADLQDGLLHIELKRELPEAKKPRVIQIGATATTTARVIEGAVAAGA